METLLDNILAPKSKNSKRAQPLDDLMRMLAKLPGLGPRSARRMALHLLKHRETDFVHLIQMLTATRDTTCTCMTCGNYDTQNPCFICADPARDTSSICVVEDVDDLWALERSGAYKGRYHILGGTLSALAGTGPDQLKVAELVQRVQAGGVKELILALGATVEGQTTAHYIAERVRDMNVAVTRPAQGMPMGGELDYLDDGTLITALKARKAL